MQTKEMETAAVAASGPAEAAQRSRPRKLVAVLIGVAALAGAAVGVVVADDDGDDVSTGPPTTQVIPFEPTAPSGSGVSSADG